MAKVRQMTLIISLNILSSILVLVKKQCPRHVQSVHIKLKYFQKHNITIVTFY